MTWWGAAIDQMTPEERERLRSAGIGGALTDAAQAAGSRGFGMLAPGQALAAIVGGAGQGARQGSGDYYDRQYQGAQLHHMQTMDALSEQQAQLEQFKTAQAMQQQEALNKGVDAYGAQHPEMKDQLTLLRYLDPSKAADMLSGGTRMEKATIAHMGVSEDLDRQRLAATMANEAATRALAAATLANTQANQRFQQDAERQRLEEAAFTPAGQMARLKALNDKIATHGGKWEALTPAEQADYRTFHDQLTAPKTSFDPTTGQATTTTSPLSGYVTPPPPDATGGGAVANPFGPGGQGGASPPAGTVHLPGGGTATTTQVTPGTQKVPPLAGLVPGALEDIGRLRTAFVNPDGSVNRSAIYATNPPGQSIPLLGRALEGGLPGTQGTELHPSFLRAADALLRIKTGAQANDQEIAQLARSYMPSTGDTDAAVRQKLDALERDLRNAGGALTSGVVNPALKLQPGGTPQTAQPVAPPPAKPGQAPAGLKLSKADVDATAKAHGKSVDETLGMWAHINGVTPDEARRLYEGG